MVYNDTPSPSRLTPPVDTLRRLPWQAEITQWRRDSVVFAPQRLAGNEVLRSVFTRTTVDSDYLEWSRTNNRFSLWIDAAEVMRWATGGNVLLAGYLRVGSLVAPTNVTAGDLTTTRLLVGTNAAFPNSTSVYFNPASSNQVRVAVNNSRDAMALIHPNPPGSTFNTTRIAAIVIEAPAAAVIRSLIAGIWVNTNGSAAGNGKGIGVQNEGLSDSFYANVTAGGTAYAADLDGASPRGLVVAILGSATGTPVPFLIQNAGVDVFSITSANVIVGTDGSAPALTLAAMDGTNAGGELRLNGAAANADWIVDNDTGTLRFFAGGVLQLQLHPTIADTETALIIRRDLGGVEDTQRVTQGAVDSGGAGFRLLRVPN